MRALSFDEELWICLICPINWFENLDKWLQEVHSGPNLYAHYPILVSWQRIDSLETIKVFLACMEGGRPRGCQDNCVRQIGSNKLSQKNKTFIFASVHCHFRFLKLATRFRRKLLAMKISFSNKSLQVNVNRSESNLKLIPCPVQKK